MRKPGKIWSPPEEARGAEWRVAAAVCSWAVVGLVASGEEQRQRRLYRRAGRGVDTVCLAVTGLLGEDVGQSKLIEIRFFEIRESRERFHVLDDYDAPLDADELVLAELA